VSLTVVNVAYPFASVGADAVGGAEQIVAQLDAALVAAGHRSIVIARQGSAVAGELVATDAAAGVITDAQRERVWATHARNLQRVLAEREVDVVHFHGVDFAEYLPPPGGVPLLATLHLPPSWYGAAIFRGARQDLHLHCVSHSQQRACPPSTALLPPIANGVSLEAFACRTRKRRFTLALGRICPEKNLHVALEAGRRADIPVLLAGQVFPYEAHERYFRERIAPLLDMQRRFLGPLRMTRKRRLLTSARCLLLPTLAPETSSLVAMEALACGTPVVAFPSGAIPEIVEHGVTGFLVRDAAQMATAIDACAALDPQRCRAAARERFPLAAMLRAYFDLYRRLAHHERHDCRSPDLRSVGIV
jgi:glycosyltransferase involved in cell wall biosynthesis